MSKKDRDSAFSKPRCCECGFPLSADAADYRWKMRLYCDECKQVERIKDSWKPLGSGAVVRVAVYRSAPDALIKQTPEFSEPLPLAQQIKRIRVPS